MNSIDTKHGLSLVEMMVIIILVGIIAVWLGFVLVRWLMERRQAEAIEDGILEQARAGADQASPARRADIEELNRNLVEALAMLKKGLEEFDESLI